MKLLKLIENAGSVPRRPTLVPVAGAAAAWNPELATPFPFRHSLPLSDAIFGLPVYVTSAGWERASQITPQSTMKKLNPIEKSRATLKHLALAAAIGAAVLFTAGPPAQAAITYDFSSGLQGWTQLNPTGKAAWNGGGIYGYNSDDDSPETYWVRSPEFYVNAAGPLTVSLWGGGSGGPLVTNVADVPASAIGGAGFMGVGLRDVEAGTYVASIPSTGSSLDMTPYVNNGRKYTLDYLDYKSGGWGWCGLGNVSIPGIKDLPGTGKDIVTFSVLGVAGSISGNTITQYVPFGTPLETLQPAITVSDQATVSPASGATVDFSGSSNPVTFTVTAGNSLTNAYQVTVIVLPEAPVTINLAYNNSMDGINSLQQKGTASQVAPLAYTGTTWNDGGNGSAAASNLRKSDNTDSGISVSAVLRPCSTGVAWGTILGGNKLASAPAGLGMGSWAAGDSAIMSGFVDVLTFGGLATNHTYNIVLVDPTGWPATFQYLSQTATVTMQASTDWVSGKNHALLSNCIPNASGQITIQETITHDWSALCGFQILDNGAVPPPISNYTSWAAAQTPPLEGGADYVGPDGLSNLLIYALDGLKTDHTNGSPGILTGNVLSFTKRPAAVTNNDVTYTVESSPDLQPPWITVTDGVMETITEPYTISYTLPTSSGGSLFARLKVTQK